MMRSTSLFSQLLSLFDRGAFTRLVRKHRAERYSKGFSCWEQFVAMQENNDEGVSIMQNIAELAGMGSLGDRPLAVLTGSYLEYPAFISKELAKQGWQIWQEMQEKLLTLSSHSFRIIAERSGHLIFADQPELVLEAVRRVVEAVRQP